MKQFPLIALFCAATAATSHAATSIVGAWNFPGQNCRSPIRIGALSMVSEDVNCQFASVTRQGDTVTWQGRCDDAEGSSPQTVIAKLGGDGRLTITYVPGGNVLADLRRCEE